MQKLEPLKLYKLLTKSGATYIGKYMGCEKLCAMYRPELLIHLQNAKGKDIYITEKVIVEIVPLENADF